MANSLGAHAVCTAAVDSAVFSTAAFVATAGRLLSVKVFGEPDSGDFTTITISDTAGNTFTACGAAFNAGGLRGRMWYAKNITGHATNIVTATNAGSVPILGARIFVTEVAGADLTSPLGLYGGQGQTAVGGANAITSGSLGTPSQDGHFIDAGCAFSDAPDALDAGTGYTVLDETGVPYSMGEYRIQTTAAAVTATFSTDAGSPSNPVTVVATYKPAGGGSPVTVSPSGSEASTESGTPTVVYSSGIIHKIRWP